MIDLSDIKEICQFLSEFLVENQETYLTMTLDSYFCKAKAFIFLQRS